MSNQETENTTETETPDAAPAAEAKPKKAKKKGVGQYPFRSKKSILAEIATSDVFALHCLTVIYARQTEHEQDTKSTKSRNARGFMSSHAVRGSELACKINSGEDLEDEDVDLARALSSRYGKQLAQHYRAEQIASDPALAAVAEVFSAN